MDDQQINVLTIKELFKNVVIKNHIFNNVKSINRLMIHQIEDNNNKINKMFEDDALHSIKNKFIKDRKLVGQVGSKQIKCYNWSQVYQSFERLCYFGYLKELKERLENEEIDRDINRMKDEIDKMKRKSTPNNIDNNKIIDHRIVGLAKIACERGHLDIIKYLNQHPQSHLAFSVDDMTTAISNQHLEIALYLLDNRSEGYRLNTIAQAASRGYNQLLELLLQRWNKDTSTSTGDPMNAASTLEGLQIFHRYGWKCDSLVEAINQSSLEMVEFIYNSHDPMYIEYLQICDENIPPSGWSKRLAKQGKQDMLLYLVNNFKHSWIKHGILECDDFGVIRQVFDKQSIKSLTRYVPDTNQFPIIEYYINKHQLTLRPSFVTNAKKSGNWELLDYLIQAGHLENDDDDDDDCNSDSSSYSDMDSDEENSFNFSRGMGFGILQYCPDESDDDDECDEVDDGCSNGRLNIVKSLHYKFSQGFTAQAMTKAIKNNHFDIVQFLHKHRKEGYKPKGFNPFQVKKEILQFLFNNRKEGFVMKEITESSLFDSIKYLLNVLPLPNQIEVGNISDLEILKFLESKSIRIIPSTNLWIKCNNQIFKYLLDHCSIDKLDFDMFLNCLGYMDRYDALERIHLLHSNRPVWKVFKLQTLGILEVPIDHLEIIKYLGTKKTKQILHSFSVSSVISKTATIEYILAHHSNILPVDDGLFKRCIIGGSLNILKLVIECLKPSGDILDILIKDSCMIPELHNYLVSLKKSK